MVEVCFSIGSCSLTQLRVVRSCSHAYTEVFWLVRAMICQLIGCIFLQAFIPGCCVPPIRTRSSRSMIVMSSNTFLDTSFSHIVSSLTKTFHFIGRALQATCRSVPEKRLRLLHWQLHSQPKASNSDRWPGKRCEHFKCGWCSPFFSLFPWTMVFGRTRDWGVHAGSIPPPTSLFLKLLPT